MNATKLTETFTGGLTLADESGVCPRVIGVVVGLALFLLGFEAGPGCLFWVLANELKVPRSFNDLGASYTNIVQWGFNLLVSFTFPLFTEGYEFIAFFIFGGAGVICTVYLAVFLEKEREHSRE